MTPMAYDSFFTRHLMKKVNSILESPKNLRHIEDVFKSELQTCEEKIRIGIKYDKRPNRDEFEILVKKLLKSPIEESLGIMFNDNIIRNIGRYETIAARIDASWQVTETSTFADRIIGFLRNYFQGSNNFADKAQTGNDFRTLHEAMICQGHEDYHSHFFSIYTAQPFSYLSPFFTHIVTEGSARHFQVYLNDRLAKDTGDARYRFALRELVLSDVADIYFAYCDRLGITPCAKKKDVKRVSGIPVEASVDNHYGLGYLLLHLAEKSYGFVDIHRTIPSNDEGVFLHMNLGRYSQLKPLSS